VRNVEGRGQNPCPPEHPWLSLPVSGRVAEEDQEEDEHRARAESGRHPDFAPVVLNGAGHIRERVQGEDFSRLFLT